MACFSDEILRRAVAWRDCVETSSNRSKCVDQIAKYCGYTPGEPWCTGFVWMIYDQACKFFNAANPIAQTASSSTFESRARSAGFVIDRKPKPGSVFYIDHKHVGFVLKVSGKKFQTVEGNSGDRVTIKWRNIAEVTSFIHVEKTVPGVCLGEIKQASAIMLIPVGFGIWYYLRKRKK